MRIAVLFVTSVLVAGCSQQPVGQPRATELTPINPSRPASSSPAAGTTPSSTPPDSTDTSTSAPPAGVSAGEAIAWVEAAPPVDGADFGVALRNGTSTSLGGDTAFTTPSGTSCMTDTRRGSAALACLVNLIDPPPEPPDVYGVWKGGWVDFDGARVEVGSAHGDPGRFNLGQGPPLPEGGSLSFGDFRCRTDATALVCVNYARQTAVRYGDDGIDTFGCTRAPTPPAGIGIRYDC